MPPLAIVFGPADVPVGENGCLTSATRTLPSEVVYFCACMIGATQNNRSMAIERRIICFGDRILGDDKSERLNIPQKLSDTLQRFDDSANIQLIRKRSTNVRYASACRRLHYHSTQQEWLNKCPICFSLSSTFPTFNPVGTGDSSPVLLSGDEDDDNLTRIGHSFSGSSQVFLTLLSQRFTLSAVNSQQHNDVGCGIRMTQAR